MTHSVFIDGAAGTTGIEIADRLAGREEFSLVQLPEAQRKDIDARREAINDSDVVILCLPDAAAIEAASLVKNDHVRIIDASSAHRTATGWTYGFPELREGQFEAIAGARFVSNPGCYPTGFLALVSPLLEAGLLPRDWPYSVHAVSGYSGGGKALIERFGAEPDLAFRSYGLALEHKHMAEMKMHAGLHHDVVFSPSVVRAYRGMQVEVPLNLAAMGTARAADLLEKLEAHYMNSKLVSVGSGEGLNELRISEKDNPTDLLEIYVLSNIVGDRVRLVARLDNLGKGASGAAVQNLNIMAGLDERTGLRI